MNQSNAFEYQAQQVQAQAQAQAVGGLSPVQTQRLATVGTVGAIELSEIGRQMTDNDQLLTSLGFLVDELGGKIEMILTPAVPSPCSINESIPTSKSPLATEMQGRNARIRATLDRLRDINDRVSL